MKRVKREMAALGPQHREQLQALELRLRTEEEQVRSDRARAALAPSLHETSIFVVAPQLAFGAGGE